MRFLVSSCREFIANARDSAFDRPALRDRESRLKPCSSSNPKKRILAPSWYLQMQCGINFFILDSRRVLAQEPKVLGPDTKTHLKPRCWDQNTSRIQILRHFEKMGRELQFENHVHGVFNDLVHVRVEAFLRKAVGVRPVAYLPDVPAKEVVRNFDGAPGLEPRRVAVGAYHTVAFVALPCSN